MSDQLLDILKYALLALLYLFFARVLWAVWSEVRGPRRGAQPAQVQVPAPVVHANVVHGPVMQAPAVPTSAAAPPGAPAAPVIGLPTDPTVSSLPAAPPPLQPIVTGRKSGVTRLVITQPRARKGAAFPLVQEISIGRTPACTVTIPDDAFVSQVHARVYTNGPAAFVEDINSTNGTYLNGRRLAGAHQIVKGDRLQIGNTIFEAE